MPPAAVYMLHINIILLLLQRRRFEKPNANVRISNNIIYYVLTSERARIHQYYLDDSR